MATESKLNQWSVKYRPTEIDDVIDNEAAKKEVAKIIEQKDVHAILIYGPSGCGKTTLAKVLARSLANKGDIIDKNIGDESGINDVRSLIAASKYLPTGDFKVFILDEVHALKGQAQSAILKTIEEPEHEKIVWILCTDRPQMLEVPLLNRLYKIGVTRPSQMSLAKLLYKICRKEKAFKFDDDKVKRICKEVASAADCVPRESLQLLKQLSNQQDSFEGFKDLVIKGIRRNAEQTIDKTAIQCIMAFYSSERSLIQRAEFLVAQLADKDAWGLTMRLTDIHHHLLNNVAGIQGGPGYYYRKELEQHKAVPDLRVAGSVALRLVDIRNKLQQVNTKVEHFIVPSLLDIVYHVDSLKSEDDDGKGKRR